MFLSISRNPEPTFLLVSAKKRGFLKHFYVSIFKRMRRTIKPRSRALTI